MANQALIDAQKARYGFSAAEQNSQAATAKQTQSSPVASTQQTSAIAAGNAAAKPSTNYGGTGNPLNEILYSKKQYDAGNKLWAAKNAEQYYGQLSPEQAALVKGMNTQQLSDYISGMNGSANQNSSGDALPSGGAAATGVNGNSSLIQNMYDNNYNAQLQALRKARETAQQGLNSVETTARQSAYQDRNLTDAQTQQGAQRLREIMASSGLLASGDNITANVGLQAAGQNALNAVNQTEANALRDVAERRGVINNNASLDEAALLKEVEAARMNALLQDNYYQDNRAIQLAQLLGTYNGQQTLDAKNADRSYDLNLSGLSGRLPASAGGGQTLQSIMADRDYTQQQWQNNYQVGRDQVADDQWAQQFQFSKQQYGEQFAYQQARDSIQDVQWQKQFDEDVRRYGLDYGLQQQQMRQSAANTAADNARANAAAGRAARSAEEDRLFAIWERTGVAPAGIAGVAPGTPLYDAVAARQTAETGDSSTAKVSAKDSANNYNLVLEDLGTKGVTKAQARQLLQANSAYLTDSDYRKLNDYINDNILK